MNMIKQSRSILIFALGLLINIIPNSFFKHFAHMSKSTFRNTGRSKNFVDYD